LALVAGATLIGTTMAGVGNTATAAKPGPGAVRAQAGHVVKHNGLKPGTIRAHAAEARVVHGKSPGVTPLVKGYVVVSSGTLSNPNSTQSFGDISCPTGKVAFGGGVIGYSSSVYQDVNSSFPETSAGVATGWAAYVDNFTGSDSTFSVWAVCAKKPPYYAVVSASFTNFAGFQNSGSVQCPLNGLGKRMKPFGGGGFGSSSGLLQNINTSIPVKSSKSWRVDMNNAEATDQSATVYAVCGLRAGWAVLTGASVTNFAGSQNFADATCSAGKTAVGGGVFSSSGSTSVNLNSTFPVGSTVWRSFENNATASDTSITPYVVCLT